MAVPSFSEGIPSWEPSAIQSPAGRSYDLLGTITSDNQNRQESKGATWFSPLTKEPGLWARARRGTPKTYKNPKTGQLLRSKDLLLECEIAA